MWNKLVEFLQQPAVRRLSLAIIISAVLHSVFFGNLHFSQHGFKSGMHLIEASIVTPKPAPQPIAEALPAVPVEPSPDSGLVPLPEPEPEPVPMPVQKDETVPVAEAVPSILPELAATPLPEADNVDPVPILQPTQPDDAGIAVTKDTYQFLETEFEVRTAIDGGAVGKATITYNVIENMQYRIRWLTEGNGVMALLFPELLQTSEGKVTQSGLQPNHYLYQFGKKSNKTRSASFDWQAKKVVLQTAKGTKTEDLPEGTQDLLSFMYQFMHVAPLQNMQLPIVNGKKLNIYDYSFEGEEQLNLAFGALKTLHIVHSGSSEEEKTELWLTIDYFYVPVKIRKIESDGSVVEMVATSIITDRDVNPQ